MNPTFVVTLVLIAFVWAVASIYYQQALRPYITDSVRFSIFARRDELRGMAVDHRIDPNSFSFRYLETLFNRMVKACSWLSFTTLIEFELHHRAEQSAPDVERFDAEASDELKSLERAALDDMLIVMAANSPGWTILAGICYYASKGWIIARTRLLWHEDLNELMPAAA